MPKTNAQRFTDSHNYLKTVDQALATHVEQTMTAAHVTKDAVGADLTLGTRFDVFNRDETTTKRHAIRALLLCQRVYFSNMWARMIGFNANCNAYPLDGTNPGTWETTRNTTATFWDSKTEPQIKDAIRVFTHPATTATALKTAAEAAGGDFPSHPSVNVSRTLNPFPGHKTCYSAVMFWLFKSGIVSYRWMMKNWGTPSTEPHFTALFGNPTKIWQAATPFDNNSVFPNVPIGHIVHLYVNTPAQYLGHWLVSAGNGKAYGRNNDEEKDLPGGNVNRLYALCNLKHQFLAYKGDGLQGIAEVIDPMTIPHRI